LRGNRSKGGAQDNTPATGSAARAGPAAGAARRREEGDGGEPTASHVLKLYLQAGQSRPGGGRSPQSGALLAFAPALAQATGSETAPPVAANGS
jgi:hypothetical protein